MDCDWQIATAVWIIDQLALRVGGEKGDDEADTVGCCSLRKEHLTFNAEATVHEIDLEFLGKDSMLFKQTIDFDKYGDVGTKVFHNLVAFCKNKRQSQKVFDRLDPRCRVAPDKRRRIYILFCVFQLFKVSPRAVLSPR